MMMVIEDGMHMGAVKCVKSFDWFGGLQINARTHGTARTLYTRPEIHRNLAVAFCLVICPAVTQPVQMNK